ncbi:hypothetical protein HYV81_04110 [Candidatus Woesearchaeota archaeon]|nr:hypothetical protein [Candidatus Woesearchaeota archaeon]
MVILIKRKVVQHGPSTLIISLPFKWIRRHNIRKGDELQVDELEDKIMIAAKNADVQEKITLDIMPFGKMVTQIIRALYKRGVDEIKLLYDYPDMFDTIEKSLGNESVSFEVLETGNNFCIIKNVSEGSREFEHVLRQTFILLLSMSEEGCEALKQGNLSQLNNLKSLEEVNNRFTAFCRRYLNTKGPDRFDKVGPIYYIVEHLERIADVYKYLYSYLGSLHEPKIEFKKELLAKFSEMNAMFRKFYNQFYKFNPRGISEIKEDRDRIIKDLLALVPSLKKPHDIMLFHHLLMLTNDIFSLLDPYLLLSIKEYGQKTQNIKPLISKEI